MNILVVVDMQNDFIDGSLGTEEAQRIVPEVVKKIQTFDGTVFATRDTHEENYLETAEEKNFRSDIVSVEQKAGRSDRRSSDLLTEAPVDKVDVRKQGACEKAGADPGRDFDREHYADRALYRYLRDLQCHAL